jgi:hypothetical protein
VQAALAARYAQAKGRCSPRLTRSRKKIMIPDPTRRY